MVPERNDALLSSFAAHLYLLRQEIDVHAVDSAQLRQAHPGRVEQLQYRQVSHVGKLSFLCPDAGGLKENLDLRAIQITRKVLVRLRSLHTARGVRLDLFVS